MMKYRYFENKKNIQKGIYILKRYYFVLYSY